MPATDQPTIQPLHPHVLGAMRARAQDPPAEGTPTRVGSDMRYARRTEVPASRSRQEVENLVTRYGADQFGSALDHEGGRAMIQFRIATWLVRFVLPLKDCTQQQERQRWRALVLVVKAKLEAVEDGITTFEEEFLPHIVTPGGQTFGEWAVPQIRELKKGGQLPGSIMGAIEDRRGK